MTESKAKLKNLFQPGAGVEPPYLAGRLEEQTFFNDQVEKLVEGQKIGQDMIVYGPRGNGKTVMLAHLETKTLEAEGNKPDILWVTPSEFETLEGLVDLIIDSDQDLLEKAKDMFRNLIGNTEFSANVGVASVKTTLNQPRAKIAMKALLHEKSKKKPFILIMDEAHTLNPSIGNVLLNASQSARRKKSPFFLVLAGTPNLEAELQKADASFWGRNKRFPLGRLSAREAQEALTIPLKEHQVTFAQGIIKEVVSRAHRYPYFLQIWGDCIANRLVITGAHEVTMETLSEVEEKATIECKKMYRDRYNELNKMGLVPLATDIGRAFADEKYIPIQEFDRLAGKALQNQELSVTHEMIFENISKLSHIGYIWQIDVPSEVEGEDPLLCYEPGIPSLMRYVQSQTLSQSEM